MTAMHDPANTVSAAAMFVTLADIVAALQAAEKKGNAWKCEQERVRTRDGPGDDGLDIRIRIYPAGVEPDARASISQETILVPLKPTAVSPA